MIRIHREDKAGNSVKMIYESGNNTTGSSAGKRDFPIISDFKHSFDFFDSLDIAMLV